MAAIGGITVLIGAALAFVQDDIKKVLAYSTISQLGYMVMALGVGAWTAAVFHLFTHAFFKADLFLGAGSVSHSGSHHSFDMKNDMGGLRKYMPQTYKTFVIGTLALVGHLPARRASGRRTRSSPTPGHNGYKLFLVVGLVGAFMTAAYMTRCVYLTFYGEYRGAHAPHAIPHVDEAEHDPVDTLAAVEHDAEVHAPHESNRLITTPLWVLSFFAVFAGFLNFPHFDKFEKWFQPRYPAAFAEILHPASSCVQHRPRDRLGGAARHRDRDRLGVLPGQAAAGPERSATRSPRAGKKFLVNKYYLDDLYDEDHRRRIKGPIAAGVVLVQPARDRQRAQLHGQGRAAFGRFTYNYVDQKGVDGLVNGLATSPAMPAARSASCRPDDCSSTHSCSSSPSCSSPARSGSSPRQGESAPMHSWFDSWALTLVVFIPAVGAVITMLIPREEEEAIKWTALLTTLATLGFTIATVAKFDFDKTSTLQFSVNKNWIDVINSHYHVAVDGISLPMLALSSFITVLCVIYSWNHFPEPHNPKAFLALLLILEVGMNGTFVAQDLILFFIFFEIVLLPMFFMIGVWGGPNREYASIKFFLFTLFGSALMLLCVPRALLQGRRPRRRDTRSTWCCSRTRRAPGWCRAPASSSSAGCSSGSRSRCRCSRSTRGFPMRTPRRPRSARCCWPRSC